MKRLLTALIALGLAVSAQAVTAGFTAGYLIDNEEEYITAHLGTVFGSTKQVSHTGEVEIGYTSVSESGLKGDVMPLMANYRAQIAGNGNLGGYLGAGLGMSRVKISGLGLSDSDWGFTAQVFAGFTYRMTDTASFDIGARYLNIQNVTFFGEDVDIGDDTAIEVGFHFRF